MGQLKIKTPLHFLPVLSVVQQNPQVEPEHEGEGYDRRGDEPEPVRVVLDVQRVLPQRGVRELGAVHRDLKEPGKIIGIVEALKGTLLPGPFLIGRPWHS